MKDKIVNLNKDFYAEHMMDSTIYREDVWPEEKLMLRKYLTDSSGSVVEAGAGGGRLTFFIEQLGFTDVIGFDIVPEMMEFAQRRSNEKGSSVKFMTGDASDLHVFENETFDYLVYIQQVLCFVPSELFNRSLEETYRIAKKGSITLFTFLDYESRFYNPLLSTIANTLRKIRGEKVSKYHLPWLKLNDTQFNWKLFGKNQPSVYWVRRKDILQKLEKIGFEILEVENGHKIAKGGNKGALYIACRK
ncbi:class I SAM-dependent methyltransferase [Maribacter algicola]|uniref:Class I SAM-dependent methyltransferase n=1 Tax=Meishania litoralis TaxID=3434685 RepID=A0ACC7LP29_9FLAO